MSSLQSGLRVSEVGIAANVVLAIIKIATGIIGNSYALVADGIESTTDVVSSLVVWSGLRISAKPPDRNHPYGHGKAESMAAVTVSLTLIGAALLLATQSVREIHTPHHAPEWYTLVVLVAVIVTKEALYRLVSGVGDSLKSRSLQSDAWHHRSDAVTSLAALVGISVALIGGEGFEIADDCAALVACAIIFTNGVRLLRPAVDEVMDAAVPETVENQIRRIAADVEGVREIEKCRIRKSGLGLLMDIHTVVDGDISVRRGHEIAHQVKDRLLASSLPIVDVVVHTEPDEL
ncbi:MAG: cation transporter [bacterium]|nr:cation transporter [bacterium]